MPILSSNELAGSLSEYGTHSNSGYSLSTTLLIRERSLLYVGFYERKMNL